MAELSLDSILQDANAQRMQANAQAAITETAANNNVTKIRKSQEILDSILPVIQQQNEAQKEVVKSQNVLNLETIKDNILKDADTAARLEEIDQAADEYEQTADQAKQQAQALFNRSKGLAPDGSKRKGFGGGLIALFDKLNSAELQTQGLKYLNASIQLDSTASQQDTLKQIAVDSGVKQKQLMNEAEGKAALQVVEATNLFNTFQSTIEGKGKVLANRLDELKLDTQAVTELRKLYDNKRDLFNMNKEFAGLALSKAQLESADRQSKVANEVFDASKARVMQFNEQYGTDYTPELAAHAAVTGTLEELVKITGDAKSAQALVSFIVTGVPNRLSAWGTRAITEVAHAGNPSAVKFQAQLNKLAESRGLKRELDKKLSEISELDSEGLAALKRTDREAYDKLFNQAQEIVLNSEYEKKEEVGAEIAVKSGELIFNEVEVQDYFSKSGANPELGKALYASMPEELKNGEIKTIEDLQKAIDKTIATSSTQVSGSGVSRTEQLNTLNKFLPKLFANKMDLINKTTYSELFPTLMPEQYKLELSASSESLGFFGLNLPVPSLVGDKTFNILDPNGFTDYMIFRQSTKAVTTPFSAFK